ncbi:hypothetical protein VTN02DRAFT_4963 [Thermoascus thermophilus]
MLSKALQKANTAVLLDNAANFEGAIEAYSDACQLLQLVMHRSNGSEDEKLKLQEIRNTYITRISELRRLDLSSPRSDGKALPERPLSDEYIPGDSFRAFEGEEVDAAMIETANAARISNKSSHLAEAGEPRVLAPSQIPPRRQSLLPSAFEDELRYMTSSPKSDVRSRSNSNKHEVRSERSLNLEPLTEDDYAPSPLSPRRPQSPGTSLERTNRAHHSSSHLSSQHSRANQQASNESTSWLDTIDESGASSPSSTLSKMSSIYLRRRQSRKYSNATEAEFDAALDAAVEAAYNEGLEPATDAYDGFLDDDDDVASNARRNVELAKQRVREAEREAEVAMARGREKQRIQEEAMLGHLDALDSDYVDDEAEEEERLLEEMTKGYVMDDFEFDLQSKSALPRQSGSSIFSGRTWGSSVASNTTTAGTSLSTLAEGVVLPSLDAKMQLKKLPHPPPVGTLPPPPVPSSSPPTLPLQSAPSPSALGVSSPSRGVRARRLSGQNLKQLKIETNTRVPAGSQAPRTGPPSIPLASPPPPLPRDELKTGLPVSPISTAAGATESRMTYSRTLYRRNGSIDSLAGESPTAVPLTKFTTQDSDDFGRSGAPSPSRPIGRLPSGPEKLRKNVSSSSLRALRVRNMSVSTPDISTDSPGTPSSITFPSLDLQKGMATGVVPTLPTPTGAHFTPNSLPAGGLYLFDSNIHSPTIPGEPNPMAANAPIPLEPCPESFLLRPFWLMRCLYQTIAHPRGGYLSTKLFIPRDVWRVKNVKIKAVEEKVSNCDLLTAALLKLAQVDTYDADAVLEEMQSLENVLDQVQTSLTKKLGNEVGVQGTMQLFKSTTASEDAIQASETASQKTSSGTGKSYLSSWRKLRSKNSGLNTTNILSSSKENGKDNLTISSLPMTATPSTRVAKRNVTQLQFTGPNANYMGALARLFDAVQVLDQIARQVEDPGLRHSSPTLVGLELSTRHAAEFFGFYICRFALNDVSMMLDKFIKRGSEWVLI